MPGGEDPEGRTAQVETEIWAKVARRVRRDPRFEVREVSHGWRRLMMATRRVWELQHVLTGKPGAGADG